MKYSSTHKRKVRGELVHDDISKKNIELKRKSEDTKKQEELKRKNPEEIEEVTRKEVESVYLTPKIENFVETKSVKNIENRVKLWLNTGYPVHIIGPTGCGKTTVAMHVAKELGHPVVWINGDEQITTTDLIGGYSQVETESLRDKYIHNVFKSKDIVKANWVDNPLTLACRYGYTLVYNEFSRTRADANNILLSVLAEGILELPTKSVDEDRYVKVHPNFNLILTSNSVEYAGVHRPQDALLDRTIGIYMDFYDFNTEVKIIKAHTGISHYEARDIVKVVRALREKLPEAQKPGTRAGIMVARGIMASDKHDIEDKNQFYIDILATKVKNPTDLHEKQKLINEILKS